MMCSGFFLLITVWVFLYGWHLGRNTRHSHPNHRPCRAWQSSHPEKKKIKKYPLDKKNERNMEWILGLKPKDNMNWYERVWAHSRFIRTLVWRFGSVWTLLHWISMASIFISSPPPKKKMRREVCCLAVDPSTVQPVVIVCCCLPLCP